MLGVVRLAHVGLVELSTHKGLHPGNSFNDCLSRPTFSFGYKPEAIHGGTCVWFQREKVSHFSIPISSELQVGSLMALSLIHI